MKVNSKIEEQETITDSKPNAETPKSTTFNFKRGKAEKNLFLMDPIDAPKLWKQSSSSMSREKSPSHKIPNALRFRSQKEEEMKNSQFLTLQLRADINSKKSSRFPLSKRPEHFVKTQLVDTPSPATYHPGFLEETQSLTITREFTGQTSDISSIRRGKRGTSIPLFNSHHKSYIEHSKHRPYQPQNTEQNPGPGHYNHNWVNKKRSESYSIRVTLKKFNDNKVIIPGPGTYTPYKSERFSSINAKGTIPHSKRTYLTKFQDIPGPEKYNVARFLEQYT